MEIQNSNIRRALEALNPMAGPVAHPPPADLSAAGISQWIRSLVARQLGASPDRVDLHVPFDAFGLDSATIVQLTAEIEEGLDLELDVTALYDYPTVAKLAGYLATTAGAIPEEV